MKKSMLNVITLALVLINLILTVLLTFSLVSTNNKTNNLISKVSQIIDLDVEGVTPSTSTSTGTNITDTTYIDVSSNDSTDITVSYTDSGKTHYVVLNVSLGLNTKARDYETKRASIENNMRVIVSQINTEALKYSYNQVTTNKAAIEENLLTYLQDLFETDMITSVTLTKIVAQ
jgi:CCR4-NOT transcriptional regulation complex NOT5 subunit